MAATVTWDTLRELAGFRSDKGCAITLYVDLDPSSTPTAGDAETRLRSLLSDLEKEADSRNYNGDRKQALRADLDRIRNWWSDEFDRDGVRGVAIFASSPDNFWRPLPVSQPLTDEVRLARDLYLAPLVPLVGRGDGALVAFVSRERGQVFRLRGGRLEEVADESEEQPGQHDQGGWSQARYQRHIEKLVHNHLKAVGGEIDKRVRRRGDLQMVIVAPEELRGDIEGALSNEAREAIVGWAQARSNANATELLEVVRPHLDEARGRQEEQALERWREEAGRHGRAAAGWEQTLEAASDGRVEMLLVEERANRVAYQCPQCGRGSSADGSCPLDGNRLEQREDGNDLAVHHVLAHGGSVLSLGRDALAEHEGIGALLRF
jgi:peptide chain release factor subunit 1